MGGVFDGTIPPLGYGDPERLGPWKLVGGLGAGGMGVVYLGESGDRLAAVKAVSAALGSSAAFRARFRREVAICQRVSGPQIAELYSATPMGRGHGWPSATSTARRSTSH